MHLKTLTVRGFKSFASATTFEFEPGVTAVVGPNGSGKSNVVDALAWVMGEQGAKSLRGGSMEDVIFAGTVERQPLGRAAVSLTIDNTDGALPIEYSEVTISRTMFRSGGSEYTINGTKCRLLDIQELLSDSGLGREMHVIVGQGQLDQILQATGEQRRGFIEEAAGVLKHRRRRERSVRKLESMQGNLDRLEDLISEISRQLAPLGRQAKVARRAQRIQYDVRDALSRLIADDLVAAATALHESGQGEQADRARAERLKSSLAEQDQQITSRQQQAEAQRRRAEQLTAGRHRLEQAAERLRSVGSLAHERARSLYASATVETGGRDPEELRRQAEQVGAQAQEQQQEVDAGQSRLEQASRARAAAEEALKTEETRLTDQLRAVADRRAGLATLKGRVDTAQGRIDAAETRRRRGGEQMEAARAGREKAQAEFVDLEQRIAGIETGEQDLDAAYETVHQHYETLRAEHEELLAEQRRLQNAESEYTARLSGLSAARAPRDGAAALQKDYRSDHPEADISPLAERITVAAGWETALAAALGSLDTAVVTDDGDTAGAALAWLAEHDAGRAHLVYPDTRPRGSSAGTARVQSTEPPTADLPGQASWALEVVTVPEDLVTPLRTALDGVVVCSTDQQAQQLLDQEGVSTAVTDAGVIHRIGERIGGTALESSDVAITSQINELTETLEQTRTDLEAITAKTEKSAAGVSATELQVNEALEALHANDAQMSATTEQLGRLSAEVSRAEEWISGSASEIAEATRAKDEAQQQWEEAHRRLEAAESEEIEQDPSTEQRDRLAEEASAHRRDEVDARLALRAAEDQHRQMQERAASLRHSAEAEESRRQQAQKVAEDRNQRGQQAEQVSAEAEDAVEGLDAVLDRLHQAHQAARDHHEQLTEQLRQLHGARTEEAEELDELTARIHQAELRRTEQRLALEAAEQRGQEELSLTAEYLIENYGPDQPVPDPDGEPAAGAAGEAGAAGQAGADGEADSAGQADAAGEGDGEHPLEPTRPYDRAEQEARLARARKELKALGKVNPLALEEHAALEERHTYLHEQLEDLKKSRQDLLDIISEVDSTVEQVFTAAWEDTRIQFEHVFGRLFPGGEGRLELTNPEDMLNTGIEVHARPPGKRIRRLSLLSGGERSLTAVALLVAIFKARPSPFYVMDEVEAALDDTNLSRLLVIFEELRAASQLIVITHQKRTMEIADALYGVSMRQDGSTRVISQRLTGEGAPGENAADDAGQLVESSAAAAPAD